MNQHLSIGRLAKVILCGVLWQACSADERETPGQQADSDSAVAFEEATDVLSHPDDVQEPELEVADSAPVHDTSDAAVQLDTTDGSSAVDVDGFDPDGDLRDGFDRDGFEPDDPQCHVDCFGGESCTNGMEHSSYVTPVPCWLPPRYEGEGVCLRLREPCAEATCGSRGVACLAREEWLWPGEVMSSTPDLGSRTRRVERVEDGPRQVEIFEASREPFGETPFRVTLYDCSEFVFHESERLLTHACHATIERSGRALLSTPVLVRKLSRESLDSAYAGSITWWDDSQLMRLDWEGEPGASTISVALQVGVSGPVPDWAPPIEPDEGSGGVDEGSGGVDEGSGG
jgi:hypothetical protein